MFLQNVVISSQRFFLLFKSATYLWNQASSANIVSTYFACYISLLIIFWKAFFDSLDFSWLCLCYFYHSLAVAYFMPFILMKVAPVCIVPFYAYIMKHKLILFFCWNKKVNIHEILWFDWISFSVMFIILSWILCKFHISVTKM